MNKNRVSTFVLIVVILFFGVTMSRAIAQTNGQTVSEVSFPIAELGNCADRSACKIYCDEPTNVDACLNFAEKNNLMSSEEVKVAKNFKKTGMTGPGGCKGKNECNTYCGNPEHMDECVVFAEKNGIMSNKQLGEAKKVKTAIAKGIKPPVCGGKEACDAYCSSSEHMEECVTFGEAIGIISKDDAKKIRNNGGKKGDGPRNGQNQPRDGQGNGNGPDGRGDGPSNGGSNEGQGFNPGSGQNGNGPSNGQRRSGDGRGNGNRQNGQGDSGNGGPNEGQGFNPGSGQNGNGPGDGSGQRNDGGN